MNGATESLDYRMRYHLDLDTKWTDWDGCSVTSVPFDDYGDQGYIHVMNVTDIPDMLDPSKFNVTLTFLNATANEVIEWLQTAMAGGFACDFNEPGDDGYTTCHSLSEIMRLRGEVERRDNQIRNLKQLLESRDAEPR